MIGRPGVWASGWLVAAATPADAEDARPAVDLAALFAAAVDLGVDVVYTWAGPGGLPLLAEGLLVDVTGGGDGLPVWRARLSREGAPAVSVVDIDADESGAAGPWGGMAPRELLRAFVAVGRLCGVQWSDSVGHTAERLIVATHPRERGGTLLDRSPVIPAPCLEGNLELPWAAWRRELTRDESGAGWVHVFDANAQYLAAWGSVELGHGVPTHREGQAARFDPTRAGVWRVPGLSGVANLRPLLPPAVLPDREWITSPTMVRLLEVCDGLEIPVPVEAWIWPRRSRFLRAASERIRDARTDAMLELARLEAAANEVEDGQRWADRWVTADAVLEAVKSLYRVQTGRFNMDRPEASPWRRPDWGHFVRAQARANLHRRLWRLGAAPLAIATDGLVFADDEPDPRAFAERVGLPVGVGLGQYKHAATVRLPAIREAVEREPVRGLFRMIGEAMP